MATPPAPPEPPWDPSFYAAAAEDFVINVVEEGFDEFITASAMFDAAYEERAASQVMPGITRELREQAQERSPYLYGILHAAHRDRVEHGDDITGIVDIDPDVWHPILGGRPVNYGARIHSEGRTWFGWTVEEEADRIIGKYGGELLDVVGDVFNYQRYTSSTFILPVINVSGFPTSWLNTWGGAL